MPDPNTNTRYFRDLLEQAMYALRENKLRTTLSILGVAVGVAAVIIVGTIAKSGREYVFNELQTYGLTSIWIYGKQDVADPFATTPSGYEITNADLTAIRTSGCCSAVKRISPIVYNDPWNVLVHVGNRYRRVEVDGIGLDFKKINNDTIIYGRFFRKDDMLQRKPVAVITSKVHENLFGLHVNPVGKLIRMENITLTVIGVLEKKSQKFLTGIGLESMDVNDRIYIPYTLYQQSLGSKEVHTLQAEAVDLKSVPNAIYQIETVLKRRHNKRFTYGKESMLAWIDNANNYIGKVTLFGLIAASVSLVVGGLSITNIMSTSVIERTREIGIRRAIGATQKDILMQFLLEAIAISVIGAMIGILISVVFGVAISLWADFPIYPSMLIVVGSLFVACGVGLASGYFPAKRAARLRPVDALRYE